jgi:TetR/AcrR family acrAB operon transcriptional repressor/TetR/AcrR family transcriptional repressor of mexAB-oprM operon
MARRTKAEAEATRESILDSAEQVFMDKGVARASLEEIARVAGVTRGAVYWHFRNKQDILDALLIRVRAPLVEMMESAGRNASALQSLQHVCILALRKLAEDQHYFRVHYILFHRNESDQAIEKHRQLSGEAIEHVTGILSESEVRPLLREELNPEQAAYLLHTQMLGLFFDWLANPERIDLAKLAPTLVETIFRSLLNDDRG